MCLLPYEMVMESSGLLEQLEIFGMLSELSDCPLKFVVTISLVAEDSQLYMGTFK